MLVTRHGALFATRQFGSREDATAFPSANTKRIFPLEFYLPTPPTGRVIERIPLTIDP
jgi:hypothetical protein